jgi:ParB/RepB/Spo0J family partition protein
MATSTETSTVKVSEIEVPEGFNPRHEFDETALEQLAASIKKNGITTALTVARENGHYVLIDGERRLRAAKKVGVKEVPVLIRDEENALAAALVANVQREELNPIEEAEALKRLSEIEGLGTHKALAEQVGKPVPFVSKRLRLLVLPEGCHAGIANGEIPLAAEPQLRAIAKASPEVAVAATELALSDDVEASDLIDHPGNILRMLCVREGAPFIRDVSNGVTIRELVGDEEKASELEIRLEQTVENRNSHYVDHLRFVLEQADVDRLRASGRLIELPSDWEFGSDQLYLVDSELAADLAVEAVERAEREAEKAAKERAKEAGVEVTAEAPASDQLREAERAERRKEREARKREAEKAEAFNAELGATLVKRRGAQSRKAHRLNRAKVLARRVLADNPQLAGAGLRLVMPQLREVEKTTLKNGSERLKVTHKGGEECTKYLLDQIERAKTVDEVLELVADALIAAELADLREIAQSNRIHWYAGMGVDIAKELAEEIKEVKPKRGKKRS